MKISEIFYSLQGEGKYMGVPSIFVRTSYCNLRCDWGNNICDTPYTSFHPENKDMTLEEIMKEVEKYPEEAHIVITGGEPFLQTELPLLVKQLKRRGHYTTIETNATIYQPSNLDFITLSPKLSDSTPQKEGNERNMHIKNRLNFDAMQKFINNHDYQFKFVVTPETPLSEIHEIISALHVPKGQVYLMPEGVTREDLEKNREYVANLCKEGFRYSDRLHILIWKHRRGV